jgi:PKD domain
VDDQVVEGVTGTVTAVGAANANGQIFSFDDTTKSFAVNGVKGWRVTITSGALQGEVFHVGTNTASRLNVTGYAGTLNGLAVGDRYELSNRDFLAWQHYHQHIAECEFPEYARECVGRHPIKIQRPQSVQQLLRRHGATFTGRLGKPVVAVNQDLDHLVWPPVAHRYFNLARDVLGRKADERLRVYMNENVTHGNPAGNEQHRVVERDSSWLLVFRILTDWVERGIRPPDDTVVSVEPGSVTFPESAKKRRGIQPTVSARANNATRIVVPAGSLVHFDGVAESPIGKIARYDWDFEGNSQYDCSSDATTGLPACSSGFTPARKIGTPASHLYTTPGVYTPTVRVHDDTNNSGAFDGLENLSRIVVVVQ